MQYLNTTEEKKCKECNTLLVRQTTGSKRVCPSAWVRRVFCNSKCQGAFYSKNNIAEKSPNYKGGKTACADCGKTLASRYSYRATKYCASCAKKAERHPNWRGGVTPERQKLYASKEYKEWRKSVFERDGYTCVWCRDNCGRNLNADHIKPFAMFPELRFILSNGRTLCVSCHKKTDTWGYKTRKLMKQNAV